MKVLSFIFVPVIFNRSVGCFADFADDEVVGEAEALEVVVEALGLLSRGGAAAEAYAFLDGAGDEFCFGRLLIDEFERGVGRLLGDLLCLEVTREALAADGLLSYAVGGEAEGEALVVEVAVLLELGERVVGRLLVRPLLFEQALAQLLHRARLGGEGLDGPLPRPGARLLGVERAHGLGLPLLLFEVGVNLPLRLRRPRLVLRLVLTALALHERYSTRLPSGLQTNDVRLKPTRRGI